MNQMNTKDMSKIRYPLFFLGLFIIEIGGLLYKFDNLKPMDIVPFAVVGFIIYLVALAVPWALKH